MVNWNPDVYLKFESERNRPALDLLNGIPGIHRRILDLGCGLGNSTALLCERFPHAQIWGLDNSPAMIQRAKESSLHAHFQLSDIAQTPPIPGNFDLLFANASLQWVPGHREIISRWIDALAPGGVLAIQVPLQNRATVHRMMKKLSEEKRWRKFFPEPPRIYHVLEPENYHSIFSAHAQNFLIWETVYHHRMRSHESILDWYRGTGMRPYLEVLPERERGLFESELRNKIVRFYPVQPDGTVLFCFERLFMTAVKN